MRALRPSRTLTAARASGGVSRRGLLTGGGGLP